MSKPPPIPNPEDAIVEVQIDDLEELPVIDEVDAQPARRVVRWTPALGVSTKPAIRVGVMLGKRGKS